MSPRWGSTLWWTDRLTVGRKVTLTLTVARQRQDVSILHNVQTGSGAYTASCPVSTGGSFSGGLTVGGWSWNTPCILITPVSMSSRRATGWTAGVDYRQGQYVSLLHNVQTCSGAHPASYPMSTGGSFSGHKNLCKLYIFYNSIIIFSSSLISYRIPSNAGLFLLVIL
jgi:hypothetical protein